MVDFQKRGGHLRLQLRWSTQIFASVSLDGGNTFLPNKQVSVGSSNVTATGVGQAGAGKSRLLWEYFKYVDGIVNSDLRVADCRAPTLTLVSWAAGSSNEGKARLASVGSICVVA